MDFGGAEIVLSRGTGATAFSELVDTPPTRAVDDALAAVGPDSLAKVLFTSGSTALPKGVLNTHGMLVANQQSLAQIWPFTEDTPPVLVDWLPWNHTFGGNHNFNLILKRGGTLYIDAGRPAPPLIPIRQSCVRPRPSDRMRSATRAISAAPRSSGCQFGRMLRW